MADELLRRLREEGNHESGALTPEEEARVVAAFRAASPTLHRQDPPNEGMTTQEVYDLLKQLAEEPLKPARAVK